MRQVILHPGEDSYIIAECPSLPGCITQGETEQAALENIREAIELWIEEAEQHGDFPLTCSTLAAFMNNKHHTRL